MAPSRTKRWIGAFFLASLGGMRFPACLFLPLLMTCVTASAGEEVIKDSQGMDCFVYTPDPVAAAKTYQLVVGVHGARGKGNGAAGTADCDPP